MTVMDFPYPATNGQTTSDGRYYFDSSVGSSGAWRSAPLPVGGLPAGSIMAWGTNTPPANWLLADGSAVSRTVYSSLFAVIGTTYGAGDGSTTFALPDLRGRVPVGKNGATFGTLGATGGAETVALDGNNLPAHTHTFSATTSSNGDHAHQAAYAGGSGGSAGYYGGTIFNNYGAWTTTNGAHTHTVSGTTSSAGSSTAHNNLQPYTVLNYIIKASAGWTAGDSELATRVGSVEARATSVETRATALELANSTTNKSGFVPLIPSSIAVGSGTGTVNSGGLVTFTGATFVNLNGVFSSTYTNYKILLNVSSATATAVNNFRYSTAGTVSTSADWYVTGGYWGTAGAGTSSVLNAGTDYAVNVALLSGYNNTKSFSEITLTNNRAIANYSGFPNNAGGSLSYGLWNILNPTHDGFRITQGSGNFTGTVQIYGLR